MSLLAIAGAVAWTVTREDSRLVGSNGVRPLLLVGAVSAGRELCETLGEARRTPKAAVVTLSLSGIRPPALRVRVVGRGPGTVVRRYGDGLVALPLPPDAPPVGGRLCIANRGRSDVRIGGEAFPSATLGGAVQPFAASVTLVADPRSWGAQARALLGRVGGADAGIGEPATGWLVAGLWLAAVAAVLGAAWRWAA